MREIGLESSPLVDSGFMRENTVDGVYTVNDRMELGGTT